VLNLEKIFLGYGKHGDGNEGIELTKLRGEKWGLGWGILGSPILMVKSGDERHLPDGEVEAFGWFTGLERSGAPVPTSPTIEK